MHDLAFFPAVEEILLISDEFLKNVFLGFLFDVHTSTNLYWVGMQSALLIWLLVFSSSLVFKKHILFDL